jgi:hypothetical protein
MTKYFLYHFIEGKYKGVRLIQERKSFKDFKNNIDKFENISIIYKSLNKIVFSVDQTYLRKIKLNELNNIKFNSIDTKFLFGLKNSVEINKSDIPENDGPYSLYYPYEYYKESLKEYSGIDYYEKRSFISHQTKQANRRINSYNKNRNYR